MAEFKISKKYNTEAEYVTDLAMNSGFFNAELASDPSIGQQYIQ
jgi:hypothetical protein